MPDFEEIKKQIASMMMPQKGRDLLNTLVAEISRQRQEIDELRGRVIDLEDRS